MEQMFADWLSCHLRVSASSEVHSGTRQTAWHNAAILGATSMSCAMLISIRGNFTNETNSGSVTSDSLPKFVKNPR